MPRVKKDSRLRAKSASAHQPGHRPLFMTPTKNGRKVIATFEDEDQDELSPSHGLPTPPSTPTDTASFDSMIQDSNITPETPPKSKARRNSNFSLPERRSARLIDPEIITVTIKIIDDDSGKTTRFHIHKRLLTQASRVFDRAFNGLFAEATNQSMEWYDTDAHTFQILLTWIYSGCDDLLNCFVPSTPTSFSPSPCPLPSTTANDLLHLWLLADKLIIPKLQNTIIHTLEDLSTSQLEYSTETFFRVYDLTPPGSQLRAYLCDYFTLAVDIELADPEEYPPEMLAEMFMAARKMVRKKGGRFTKQRLRRYKVLE